ncbi:MAG TPA: DUF3147 family protein [Candidatus Saccharimonadales bacterium]
MEFALKVLASFLVGGAYVALVTYISEHINPRAGGVLAGLPSTALIGLIFIALTQNDAASVRAGVDIPAGFGFTTLLVALYVKLRKNHGIVPAMAKAIGGWLVLAVLIFGLLPRSLLLATIIFLICFGIAALSLEKVSVASNKRLPIGTQELVTRTLVAGTLIAIAVSLAKVLGAFIGGIIATFPVIVITSLVMLDQKRGKNLMASTAKTMPYGTFGTVGFLVGFHFLVPSLGLPAGTVLSYAASVVCAVVALQIRLQLLPSPKGRV